MKLSEKYNIDLSKVGRDMPYEQTKEFDIYEFIRKFNEPEIIRFNSYQAPGLLGFASIYGNRIGILDSLNGEDFDRVLKHEEHHLNNGHEPEYQVREKTRTSNYSPNREVSCTN